MENVSFTFDDAQRISETVQAVERSKFATKPIDQTNQGDEFVIIYVSATTKYSDGSQNGNMSFWNDITHLFAQYSPTQTVRVRAANTADTLPVGYVFARYQGITTRSDSSVGPLYIAVGSSASAASSGGSAVIDVVTDVVVTPTGLDVTYATFSGADYDNAVIKQFLALSDVTPSSYIGNQNRCVKVNNAGTALEFGAITDVTASTFIALTDTPSVWGTTNAYKTLTVSSTNNSVVFSLNNVATTGSIAGGGNPNDPSYVALSLVNDKTSPGNYYAYSTNSSGVKGWNLQAATPAGLTVGGNVVVSARKAAVADVAAHTISSVDLVTAASTTQTAIDDLTTQLNLLLARIRSHGLIS